MITVALGPGPLAGLNIPTLFHSCFTVLQGTREHCPPFPASSWANPQQRAGGREFDICEWVLPCSSSSQKEEALYHPVSLETCTRKPHSYCKAYSPIQISLELGELASQILVLATFLSTFSVPLIQKRPEFAALPVALHPSLEADSPLSSTSWSGVTFAPQRHARWGRIVLFFPPCSRT
jgi:hypothetical protein